MKYILSGDPKEVQKVLQENRVRVERGLINFTPLQPEEAGVTDAKDPSVIVDTKEPSSFVDEKTPKAKRTKKSE